MKTRKVKPMKVKTRKVKASHRLENLPLPIKREKVMVSRVPIEDIMQTHTSDDHSHGSMPSGESFSRVWYRMSNLERQRVTQDKINRNKHRTTEIKSKIFFEGLQEQFDHCVKSDVWRADLTKGLRNVASIY